MPRPRVVSSRRPRAVSLFELRRDEELLDRLAARAPDLGPDADPVERRLAFLAADVDAALPTDAHELAASAWELGVVGSVRPAPGLRLVTAPPGGSPARQVAAVGRSVALLTAGVLVLGGLGVVAGVDGEAGVRSLVSRVTGTGPAPSAGRATQVPGATGSGTRSSAATDAVAATALTRRLQTELRGSGVPDQVALAGWHAQAAALPGRGGPQVVAMLGRLDRRLEQSRRGAGVGAVPGRSGPAGSKAGTSGPTVGPTGQPNGPTQAVTPVKPSQPTRTTQITAPMTPGVGTARAKATPRATSTPTRPTSGRTATTPPRSAAEAGRTSSERGAGSTTDRR